MFTIKLPITNTGKIVPIIWDSRPIPRKLKIPMIKLIIMVTRIFAKTWSAARLGQSDLGVNLRRVEYLFNQLEKF